jgi:hypothetical protein
MRLSFCLTVVTSVSLAFVLEAQSSRSPDFRPLEFLVGRCWVGTFPDGKQTDEHCFEWVFDHKFVRDRHVVRHGDAPYAGETLYGWDPKEKRLAFWYWNSDGEILRGTVEYAAKRIVFPTEYDTETGPVELRAIWTPLGPDHYRAEEQQHVGSEWKTLRTMEFTSKS